LKAENKKPRPGTSRPESGFDMKTKNGNLQKVGKTHTVAPEWLRETTRADGKTTRPKTKRRTHWSKCVTMREAELNFYEMGLKIKNK
jgi:hypothetical protein